MCSYQIGCPIPLADDPDKIVIPKGKTPDEIVKNLTYVVEDEILPDGTQSSPLFGGHQNWSQREESFRLTSNMKVKIELQGTVLALHIYILSVKACASVVCFVSSKRIIGLDFHSIILLLNCSLQYV